MVKVAVDVSTVLGGDSEYGVVNPGRTTQVRVRADLATPPAGQIITLTRDDLGDPPAKREYLALELTANPSAWHRFGNKLLPTNRLHGRRVRLPISRTIAGGVTTARTFRERQKPTCSPASEGGQPQDGGQGAGDRPARAEVHVTKIAPAFGQPYLEAARRASWIASGGGA